MSILPDIAVFQDPSLPFQDPSTDWMGKDALDLLPWDISFDEPFDVANDFVDPQAYTISTSASPEDALSFSSLASVRRLLPAE